MNESKVVRYDLKLVHCDLIEEDWSGRYVTHADYRALEERYEALKVTEREGYAEYHRTRVELASIKARAAEYERAVTEQAMLTECVSVAGRDPSDVIRDVIQWHVSNAAQPVEAADEHMSIAVALSFADDPRPYHSLAAPADTNGELYRALSVLAREYRAALAHPRPTGEQAGEVVSPDSAWDAFCKRTGLDANDDDLSVKAYYFKKGFAMCAQPHPMGKVG